MQDRLKSEMINTTWPNSLSSSHPYLGSDLERKVFELLVKYALVGISFVMSVFVRPLALCNRFCCLVVCVRVVACSDWLYCLVVSASVRLQHVSYNSYL